MIKILKASAGAGKTYRLVYEYIATLMGMQTEWFRHEGAAGWWSANRHRYILAVTFTRNSTREMKERIIAALFSLSRGGEQAYQAELMKELGVSDPELIALAAKRLLTEALYDYGNVRVSTIDSFFQQIVGTFMRELDIDVDPTIELNSDMVRERAVDELLSRINQPSNDPDTEHENKALSDFITRLSNELVEGGSKWDIRKRLIKMSENILSDDFIAGFNHDIRVEDVTEYQNTLKEQITGLESEVQTLFLRMGEIKAALPDKVDTGKRKPKPTTLFNTQKSKAIDKCCRDISKMCETLYDQVQISGGMESGNWFNKDAFNAAVALGINPDEINAQLTDLARKIYDTCDAKVPNPLHNVLPGQEAETSRIAYYKTADYIRKFSYITGLASSLDAEIKSICRQNDVLLLNFTGELIRDVSKGADTAFIFERVGLTTTSFMIDEFQDTSLTQWDNMRNMISDSMSYGTEAGHENDSLVVGDVKQSIYRFRGGSWQILGEKVYQAFHGRTLDMPLNQNFRSAVEIINFNNRLYETLATMRRDNTAIEPSLRCLPASIAQIYSHDTTYQFPGRPDHSGGIVEYTIFPPAEKDDETEFADVALPAVMAYVEQLRRSGGDDARGIAILMRTHDEEADIARALIERDIPFVSSQSLLLADDIAVRTVVALMRYVNNPLDRATEHVLRNMLYRVTGSRDIHDRTIDSLRHEALTDFTHLATAMLRLDETDNGAHRHYLNTLNETVKQFVHNTGGNIGHWLEYWDECKNDIKVPAPENSEAVRLLTLHSSKGLQFRTVILYMDAKEWKGWYKNNNGIDTIVPTGDARVPTTYVRNGQKAIKNTAYAELYDREVESICIDQLNNLYVSTTRATDRLYIVARTSDKAHEYKADELTDFNLVDLLANALATDSAIAEMAKEVKPADESEAQTVAATLIDHCLLPEPGIDRKVDKRPQLRFNNDSDEQLWGKTCHDFMSRIDADTTAEQAVERMVGEGKVAEAQADDLRQIYDNIRTQDWYHDDWQVSRERDLAYQGEVLRPDRVAISGNEAVVVDYKFGHNVEEKYKDQVRSYCRVMEARGFHTRGVIYYYNIDGGKKVEVQ